MTAAQKRFNEFKWWLDTETPQVREAAIKIIKILDQLPTKKQRIAVIEKTVEKLKKP